jgi:hypothetical protein
MHYRSGTVTIQHLGRQLPQVAMIEFRLVRGLGSLKRRCHQRVEWRSR